METKKTVNKKFITRSIVFFKPFWKYFGVVAIFMAVGQAIAAFSPYMFGRGVDAVIGKDARMTIFFVVVAFVLALIQSEFLVWIRERIEVSFLDDNIDKVFSIKSLKRMLEFSIGQHTNEHSGVKQSVMNKGQNSLQGLMFSFLYNILPSTLQTIVTLIILAFFDWQISVLALFFVILYVWISYNRNTKYFSKIEAIRKKRQDQGKLQSEFYRNATLVIGEGQEQRSTEEFEKVAGEVSTYSKNTWLDFLNVFYKHKMIILIGQYACLALGVYLIFQGKHSPGMFVTMFAWISSIFGNVMMVMNMQRHILAQVADIKKYYDLLDIKPDIDSNVHGATPEHLAGDIEFKNVSFSYPYRKSSIEDAEEKDESTTEEGGKEQDNAITNISFKIPAGAKVGFVGKSGSGKSTIVNLIRRYYDTTEGEILIDGMSLKDINLRWLRGHIGNVEQKIDLFDRSIRDNILFGMPIDKKVEDKDLDKAVKDASLTEFITKLKDHGLDTMIGENGIKVSGGERQRIGIARALIKNPKIMIFDEATSALDAHNEKLIHDAINKGSKGRTTIIVAHRLSTIADADKIFVVNEGHIVGEGTHTELAKSCPEYKELIKHQVF